MSTANRILLAGTVVLLMAGPAYPQNRDILQLQKDVIELKNSISQMQTGVDQKNQAILSLVEKIFDQVNGLAGNMAKMNQTVEGASEKMGADVRGQLGTMTTRINDLTDAVAAARAQLGAVSQQITSMKTTSEQLPGPDESWRAAKLDVTVGNYDLALQEFSEFQAKYPTDPRSAEAQILKGDSLAAQKKYDQAEIEYDSFLQRYPENDKTSTALYKKGLAQIEMNNPKALATLQQVVSRFPKSAEAPLATAKIKEMSTGARGKRGPGHIEEH